jgi:hypothetical protein
MNKTILKITLGAVLAAFSINANAQKAYTQGAINYAVSAPIGTVDTKVYFTTDSSAVVTVQGPATIKVLNNSKNTFMAVVVDVPVASIQKAAVFTPAELQQAMAEVPKFTFTPTTETKQINGFNCKKVTAKEAKTGSSMDVWVTSDFSMPLNSITTPFAAAGGVPVQFTTVQQGQTVNVELKSVSTEKIPTGTFGIPAGFDKISFSDLKKVFGQ